MTHCYYTSLIMSWWRHQMETFSALLALCAGNSPVTGEFPTQKPVTRSFDVFLDLRQNKRLSKQSWCCWFETPASSLWRHGNDRHQAQFPLVSCSISSVYWSSPVMKLKCYNLDENSPLHCCTNSCKRSSLTLTTFGAACNGHSRRQNDISVSGKLLLISLKCRVYSSNWLVYKMSSPWI